MKAGSNAKLLVVDMVSPPGHLEVNYFFVTHVFPHLSDYCYMIEPDLYGKMIAHYHFSEKPPAVFFPTRPDRARGRISAHVHEFNKARYILDFMNNNNIRSVYFLSYHTLSLSRYANDFKDYKVILMNHDNISRFRTSALRRQVLSRLKDFTHAVYSFADDPSIVQRLYGSLGFREIVSIDYGLDTGRRVPDRGPYSSDAVRLYAPSNTNDGGKIIDLLQSLQRGRITVRAKVDERTYRRHQGRFGGELFSGFLEAVDYEQGMNNTDFVVLLYPDDYTFRTSGVLFDAIQYEKPVITDSRFLYEAYLEKRGLGILINNARAVDDTLSRIGRPAYETLVQNIRNYKRSFSAEKAGRDIAETIHHIVGR